MARNRSWASEPPIPQDLKGRVLGDRRILPVELGQEAGDPLLGLRAIGQDDGHNEYDLCIWGEPCWCCRGSVMNFSSTAAVSVTKFLRL